MSNLNTGESQTITLTEPPMLVAFNHGGGRFVFAFDIHEASLAQRK